MNGSRSPLPRHGERSSLDALNRTIEGLEARIEGLMAGSRETRGRADDRPVNREQPRFEPSRNLPLRDDPVSEIMQRQRALEAGRERSARSSERHTPAVDQRAPAQHAFTAPDTSAKEIAQALVGLRQDLKKDIADGLERQMSSLRAEVRGIRQMAETQSHGDDMRADLQRLAASIGQLDRQSGTPAADSLREEFDALRYVLDGLAREESVRRMEDRWNGVEQKLSAFDQSRDDELVALAYRLDELKAQINNVSATPALRDLEDKLQTMAQAVEGLGRSVQPDDRRLASQFEGLDSRLDEISRAIAASGRAQAAPADSAMMQRLEARIADLAGQLDAMARRPSEDQWLGQDLGRRMEVLASRVEELAGEEAALRLEERIDQLSQLLEQAQQQPPVADLADYLSDISNKIDALDHGTVNTVLAERLDHLARRIDGLEVSPEPRFHDDRFERLEGRLSAIADRLDETRAAPEGDHTALRGLEAQIAHLSSLISTPQPSQAGGLPLEFENRMATLEDYMATNDEYIIEAARQAAEAVMEAYQRNGTGASQAAGLDMAAISALADDLRALEDLTRSSEERTARTFDALHDTLVQIAGRLEQFDAPREAAPAPRREETARRESAHPMPRAEMPVIGEADFRDDEYPFVEEDFSATAAREPAMRAPDAYAQQFEPEQENATAAIADAALSEPAGKAQKSGLIAGLAKRLVPGRREAPARAERQQIDPAPSLDPGDELAPEVANQLLEPGSGVPDVRRILERVRAGQASGGRSPAGETDKSDFIAAARRAARMAAEESDEISRVAAEKKTPAAGSAFSRHRRPILMAVGAVLLAIMSYPLVSTLVSGDRAPAPAVVERAAAPDDDVAQDAGSLADDPDVAFSPVPEDTDFADAPSLPADNARNATTTGADLLTRQAEIYDDEATAGFEPVETSDGEDMTGVDTGDVADLIIVPEAVTPASLARAAGEGDRLALFEIGARYTEGRGMATDLAEASRWYRFSADRGFAPAQYRLANLYEKGQGVERDLGQARALYEKAAAQGNASAMHNLAVLLATGSGDAAPDFDGAAKWFQQAADFGVRDSQFNLAILFARGNGVPQDLEESYKWFAIAARDGDRDAAGKRDEVANAMRPEQLESAKAKFDLWTPKPLDEDANSVDLPDEWAGGGTKTASVDMTKAIHNIQAILNNNGFNAGTPDGQMGKRTVAAIKAFQKSIGQEETGEIDDQLVTELLKRNKQPG